MQQLWVALTSDTEDNHPTYVPGWHNFGSNYDTQPSTLRWDWVRYWPELSSNFKSQDVPITWLIRVDDGPVRDSMLNLFKDEILELKSKGDEVGIHIHTFVLDPKSSRWIQTEDPKRETRIVRLSVDMFKRRLGYAPSSIRMGWFTMSNEIMRTLEACSLLVDSSAIPGTYSKGKFDGRDNIYDWSRAPHVPYHPSHDDYQSSGNMQILEIPVSTPEANKANIFSGLVNKVSGIKSLAKLIPLARRFGLTPNSCFCISPWWSLSVNIGIIKACSKKSIRNKVGFLVGCFHACDILDPKTGQKNLIFERYLSKVIHEISSIRGIDVKFTTLSEMARNYDVAN